MKPGHEIKGAITMTIVFMLVFGSLFALFGGAVEGDEGFVLGIVIGVLTGLYAGLAARTKRVEKRLREAESQLSRLAAGHSAPPSPVAREPDGTESVSAGPVGVEPRTPSPVPDIDTPPPGRRQAPGVALTNRLIARAREFFTNGNVVVKVGIVVLFFGIAFLIKYAHEHALVPIELRLAGVAACGIALLLTGWKLRASRPGYAMTMQGGGVGILYLTVFGAARLYGVVPLEFAFVLMLLLVAVSAALAVIQNAPSLAAFGTAGGFLAPVLTSTGQGSHVALFSYYAIVNLGVFGIAWFRAWRILNWLGFVFTFVIAALWGSRYYTPAHFGSTEPFLVLFVLFYVAITVLFATRQAPRLRGFVDGTLVFGVPTVAFALQSRLARDYEFGIAYSALAGGIFYLVLARSLWAVRNGELRLLAEAFLALGVVFSSLALPFALDGHWTAAAWSLEAAGILWIGLRQHRPVARAFAVLLQLGAAGLFALDAGAQTTVPVVLNSTFVGAALIAAAGLLSAGLFARFCDSLKRYERHFELALLAWGLLWWAGAIHHEITLHARSANQLAWFLLAGAASAVTLAHVARRADWHLGSQPPVLLLPALGFAVLADYAVHAPRNPFAGLYGVGWGTAIAGNFVLLGRYAATWGPRFVRTWHAGSAWLCVFLLTWLGTHGVSRIAELGEAWTLAAAGAVPAAAVTVLPRMRGLLPWPLARFESSYCGAGILPVIVALGIWLLFTVTIPGDPEPLGYVPLLNPLEASGALALVVALLWYVRLPDGRVRAAVPPNIAAAVLAGVTFAWFNSIVFRTVHHSLGVPYTLTALWQSPQLQAALSITWTILGSVVMATAAGRMKARSLWMAGAAMLGLVVLKLFTVDLADIGTVARIVSFIGVGAGLLVIGYFAPLPPAREETP